MDLDDVALVALGPGHHQIVEVVVVLDLRPLAEVLGVLHGQRMEMEGVREQVATLGVEIDQVEPEVGARGDALFDAVTGGVAQSPVDAHEVAVHGLILVAARRCVGDPRPWSWTAVVGDESGHRRT